MRQPESVGRLISIQVGMPSTQGANWSIHRANDVFYDGSRDEKQELASVAELSAAWQRGLRR